MLRTLVVEITSECTIRCRHCAPACGPLGGGPISVHLIREAVSAAREFGCPLVTASGGEPFLQFDLLLDLVQRCKSFNLKWEVVTNGTWARNPAEARGMLNELKECLPGGLVFSVDRFHQEHIELATVQKAAEVASERGLATGLKVCAVRDLATWKLLKEVARWEMPVTIVPVIALGRAKSLDKSLFFNQNHILSCRTVTCPMVTRTGHVIACCGITQSMLHPESVLMLGKVPQHTVAEALRKHLRPYFEALQVVGPTQLADWALGTDPRSGLINIPKTMNFCEICASMSRRPSVVSLIESTPLETIQRELQSFKQLALYFDKIPLRLVESAEHIVFSKLSVDKSDEGNPIGCYGVLSFVSEGRRELVLLDDVGLRVVNALYGSDDARNFFEWLENGPQLSLEQIKIRNVIARLTSLGGLQQLN